MALAEFKPRLSDLDALVEALDKKIAAASASDFVDLAHMRSLKDQREAAWRTMQATIKSALA